MSNLSKFYLILSRFCNFSIYCLLKIEYNSYNGSGNPVYRKKVRMGRYTTLAVDNKNYKRIVECVRSGYVDNNNVKHRANPQLATILVLESNLGCRIGDILKLTTDSIILDGNIYKINIIEQKTGKKRCFIVPNAVKEFIDDYTRSASIESGNLFTIKSGAVWKQLRAVTDYLGIENVSTHSFRKFAAASLYNATNHDIEAVCEFLNHSSINTTRSYIRRTDAQLERAIEKCINIV